MAATELESDAVPSELINRAYEQDVLSTVGETPGQNHLHLHGPRGTGKTVLARTALAACPDTVTTCYIPCITYNTQYKVLKQLYACLADETINHGYHTAQLHDFLGQRLTQEPLMLVLDELDFLLENDGNDLLYFLSRLAPNADLSIVGISANYPALSEAVDERTYSSLQPRHLPVDPYTADRAADILTQRVQDVSPDATVHADAVTAVTATTTNIALGLHWLAAALRTTDGPVTPTAVHAVRDDAVHRYRTTLLTDFTPHHTNLLEAIDRLTAGDTRVTTGVVYDEYNDLCRTTGTAPLTIRRTSDFLRHLELLHLIDVTHHTGGETGKTRAIRPTTLEEF